MRQAFGHYSRSRSAALLAAVNDSNEFLSHVGVLKDDWLETLLTLMNSADYARNVAWEQDQYRTLAAAVSENFAGRREAGRSRFEAAREEMLALRRIPQGTTREQIPAVELNILNSAFARGTVTAPALAIVLRGGFEGGLREFGSGMEQDTYRQTSTQAAIALTALRRWYATNTEPPPDLKAICDAAGVTDLPQDLFSGSPLRLATFTEKTPLDVPFAMNETVLAGETIVYSIGSDGIDDRALKNFGHQEKHPGDFLFRLGVPQTEFAGSVK